MIVRAYAMHMVVTTATRLTGSLLTMIATAIQVTAASTATFHIFGFLSLVLNFNIPLIRLFLNTNAVNAFKTQLFPERL